MLERVLEAEVMDTEAEARDYDAMDHREVNARFVADLLAALERVAVQREAASPLRVLDVGTGTARIPIELCRRRDQLDVTGIDLSRWMLAIGRQNVAAAELGDRIRLERLDAKAMPFDGGSFDVVMSNSIVHHVAEPRAVLAEMARVTSAGGLLFVRDLVRPADEATLGRLVEAYTADANEHQRSLFAASLRAAFTLEEVREFVCEIGLPEGTVRQTSDRHWTIEGGRQKDEA
jgi:ubiquinone/menaquinone biosynthesis C-methylase UbiE